MSPIGSGCTSPHSFLFSRCVIELDTTRRCKFQDQSIGKLSQPPHRPADMRFQRKATFQGSSSHAILTNRLHRSLQSVPPRKPTIQLVSYAYPIWALPGSSAVDRASLDTVVDPQSAAAFPTIPPPRFWSRMPSWTMSSHKRYPKPPDERRLSANVKRNRSTCLICSLLHASPSCTTRRGDAAPCPRPPGVLRLRTGFDLGIPLDDDDGHDLIMLAAAIYKAECGRRSCCAFAFTRVTRRRVLWVQAGPHHLSHRTTEAGRCVSLDERRARCVRGGTRYGLYEPLVSSRTNVSS
ncbi:hypothetical protein FB45DRAFT_278110 [Roridomyces roridus]|uniref:Uncharacterized protein n=1 Tax=Roridomyces roridus TaxID=1738132 RepID=A0AAD7CAA5_9AGAR|nr:hypothetical protein FB45DRAFT_278110 [Roridomyces roridus]